MLRRVKFTWRGMPWWAKLADVCLPTALVIVAITLIYLGW